MNQNNKQTQLKDHKNEVLWFSPKKMCACTSAMLQREQKITLGRLMSIRDIFIKLL